MHLVRHDDRLLLVDHAAAITALGGFFVLVGGVFVYGGLGGASNIEQLSLGERAMVLALGLAGVLAGLILALSHRAVRVELHRASRTFTVAVRQWGRRTVETLPPGTVTAVILRADRDSDGDLLHGVDLLLRDGRTLSLGVADATPRAEAEAIAEALQREAGVRELRIVEAPARNGQISSPRTRRPDSRPHS